MSTKRMNYYNRGIGYILFFAGATLSVWLGAAVLRGYATQQWPETTAIIYQSDVVKTTQIGEQSLYRAQFLYRFEFADQSFSGENLYRTSTPFNSESDMAEQVAQYPIGSVQKIYVNPDYPSEAVLIQGVQSQFIAGLVFAVICFAIGLRSFRRNRQ